MALSIMDATAPVTSQPLPPPPVVQQALQASQAQQAPAPPAPQPPAWQGYQKNIFGFESGDGTQTGNGGGAGQFISSNRQAFIQANPQWAGKDLTSSDAQTAMYNWLGGTQIAPALKTAGLDPNDGGNFYSAYSLGPKATIALAHSDPGASAADVVRSVDPNSYASNKGLFQGNPTAAQLHASLSSVATTGKLGAAPASGSSSSAAPSTPDTTQELQQITSAITPPDIKALHESKWASFLGGVGQGGHLFAGLGALLNNGNTNTGYQNDAAQSNYTNAVNSADARLKLLMLQRPEPMGYMPVQNADGSWSMPMRNQITGAVSMSPLGAGATPGSIVGKDMTIGSQDARFNAAQHNNEGRSVAGVGPTGQQNGYQVQTVNGPGQQSPAAPAPTPAPTPAPPQQSQPMPVPLQALQPRAPINVLPQVPPPQQPQGAQQAPPAPPPPPPAPTGAPQAQVPDPVAAAQAAQSVAALNAPPNPQSSDPVESAAGQYLQQLTASAPPAQIPAIARQNAAENSKQLEDIHEDATTASTNQESAVRALDAIQANPKALPSNYVDVLNNQLAPYFGGQPVFSGISNGQLQLTGALVKQIGSMQIGEVIRDNLHVNRTTQGEIALSQPAAVNGAMAPGAAQALLQASIDGQNHAIATDRIIQRMTRGGKFPMTSAGAVSAADSMISNDLWSGKHPKLFQPTEPIGPTNAAPGGVTANNNFSLSMTPGKAQALPGGGTITFNN